MTSRQERGQTYIEDILWTVRPRTSIREARQLPDRVESSTTMVEAILILNSAYEMARHA